MIAHQQPLKTLPVGRVLGYLGAGWLVDRCLCRGGCGDVVEGLAGDLQILALGVEFVEAGGEFGDMVPELSGLLGDDLAGGGELGQTGCSLGEGGGEPLDLLAQVVGAAADSSCSVCSSRSSRSSSLMFTRPAPRCPAR
ncbi:hypothetical protein ABZ454_36795 [Streptomyces sp. NPDC005803]|uniref:hypothetical protein n=1 Tax=Streptomyces sp. NPDC005803 TaxID=3154297 RepID=UPI0033F75AA0